MWTYLLGFNIYGGKNKSLGAFKNIFIFFKYIFKIKQKNAKINIFLKNIWASKNIFDPFFEHFKIYLFKI